jgi:cysteine synthase
MIAANVLNSIGNTPIVEHRKVVPKNSARMLVKLEWANPTGSMNDRMAKEVIEKAEADGKIKPGNTVVEYTGGTTGISLALACAAKGYRFHAGFSDAFSNDKRIVMQAFGALTDSVNPRDNWFTMKVCVKTEDGFELSTIRRKH